MSIVLQIRMSKELMNNLKERAGDEKVSSYCRRILEGSPKVVMTTEKFKPVVTKEISFSGEEVQVITAKDYSKVKVWPGCAGENAHSCGLCKCGDK
jgi:hypothetical protein